MRVLALGLMWLVLVAAGQVPFRLLEQVELWEFHPDHVVYTARGTLEVKAPFHKGLAPPANPAWRGEQPEQVEVRGPFRLARFHRRPYGGRHDVVLLQPVLVPVQELKPGATVRYGLRFRLPDVPFLHGRGRPDRLLSLTTDAPPGSRSHLLFAIPASSGPAFPTDHPPTRVLEPPGWRVYHYDLTGVKGAVTIHLSFRLGDTDRRLPEVQELLKP